MSGDRKKAEEAATKTENDKETVHTAKQESTGTNGNRSNSRRSRSSWYNTKAFKE